MGTRVASQEFPNSIDQAGLSVVTASRSDEVRTGTIYNPANLAAIALTYVHNLTDKKKLLLFSRRWHTATPTVDESGFFSAYTEDTSPGWVIANMPQGSKTLVNEQYGIPPSTYFGTPRLIGGASRATEYLYVLNSYTKSGVTQGVITHWWYNTTTSALVPLAEEAVPSITPDYDGQLVTFDRGIWLNDKYITVWGTSVDTNELYMVRKHWGRIGRNQPFGKKEAIAGNQFFAASPVWTYWTGSGWSPNPLEAQPVTSVYSQPLTSYGPVSVANFRDQSFMSTVAVDGTDREAVIYHQRGGSSWKEVSRVDLGSALAAGEYINDTGLMFQPQVTPAVDSTEMTSAANIAAIPYVINQRVLSGSDSQLQNVWGLWSVPRVL